MKAGGTFFGQNRSECGGDRSEANKIHSVPAEPQTGKLSQEEERYLTLKRRARALNYRILRLDQPCFAIVKDFSETDRHPSCGFTALDEIEAFVRTKEREAGS